MDVPVSDINHRIAAQARGLRAASGLSLQALASRSGVSRSMISLIERGKTSPTAVVLERLSAGLGVPMARLFDAPADQGGAPQPIARRAAQPQWRDPGAGYLRRNLSPPHWPSPIRMVEVHFPAGARVAYESARREPPVYQQLWLLSGRLQVTLGEQRHRLETGDCMAMLLDRPTAFANRTRQPAHYIVVCAA
jgi:transcriptional regulator with XRE-family HTH domain